MRTITLHSLSDNNLPHLKYQIVLYVFDQMLATLIISAALTIGDTLT